MWPFSRRPQHIRPEDCNENYASRSLRRFLFKNKPFVRILLLAAVLAVFFSAVNFGAKHAEAWGRKHGNTRDKSLNTTPLDEENSNKLDENPAVVEPALEEKTFNADERFIVLVALREQETRSQLHMRSMAFLAGLLNRTIIIPNVEHSTLGDCLRYPFESYYQSDEWFLKYQNHFRYATRKQFSDWITSRQQANERPTARSVRVGGYATQEQYPWIVKCRQRWVDTGMFDMTENNAEQAVLDMSKWNAKSTSLSSGSPMVHEAVVNFMKAIDAQVILMEFGPAKGWLTIPEVYDTIPYNRDLLDRAQNILKAVQPSIVVQWRMETVNGERVKSCSRLLVNHINKLKKKIHFENIFFMTDYPLVNGRRRSHSFDISPEFHGEAIEYLKANLNLTSAYYDDPAVEPPDAMSTNLRLLPVPPLEDVVDDGQLGIVEKLVAENGRYFTAGDFKSKSRCAWISAYVQQIVKERAVRWEVEKGLPEDRRRLINIVDFWGHN